MADKKVTSIFNRQALSRLHSPDDLDRYIRITNPSVWMALAAIIALIVGLLSWGVFGTVATGVDATGISLGGKIICMLDDDSAAKIKIGDHAYVNGQRTTVESKGRAPISEDEAYDMLKSDYLVDALMPEEWAYVVTLGGVRVDAEGVPLTVNITTERIAPISLVLG